MENTNNKDYSEEILSAVDIIVQKRISDLGFNRCIKATIEGPVLNDSDETGEYMVNYQNSHFKATALNGNFTLKKGDLVYVLYINNNFEKETRYILGVVNEYLRHPDKLISDTSVDLWWHRKKSDEKHTYLNEDGLQNTLKIPAQANIQTTIPEFDIGTAFTISIINDLQSSNPIVSLSSSNTLLTISDVSIGDAQTTATLNFTSEPSVNVILTVTLEDGYEYYYTFVFGQE